MTCAKHRLMWTSLLRMTRLVILLIFQCGFWLLDYNICYVFWLLRMNQDWLTCQFCFKKSLGLTWCVRLCDWATGPVTYGSIFPAWLISLYPLCPEYSHKSFYIFCHFVRISFECISICWDMLLPSIQSFLVQFTSSVRIHGEWGTSYKSDQSIIFGQQNAFLIYSQ